MNKEVKEICNKCELEINKQGKGCAFRSLGNEYCDLIENANNLINNLQNQVEKLTQENNDLEERVINQDNVIKKLKQPQIFIDSEDMEERYGEELYKEYLEKEKKHLDSVIYELEKWLKEMLDSENDIFSVVRVKDVLDKLNELRGKE